MSCRNNQDTAKIIEQCRESTTKDLASVSTDPRKDPATAPEGASLPAAKKRDNTRSIYLSFYLSLYRQLV